jgi:hypothetical protein
LHGRTLAPSTRSPRRGVPTWTPALAPLLLSWNYSKCLTGSIGSPAIELAFAPVITVYRAEQRESSGATHLATPPLTAERQQRSYPHRSHEPVSE